MVTIDALRTYGANVDEGLGRCFNNQDFYLRLVGMGLSDANFDKLFQAVDEGNAGAAFEAAHALKGAIGNLSLTPLYEPISQLTELLRPRQMVPEAQTLADTIKTRREAALTL